MELLKQFMPYIVSIITAMISGYCSYMVSKKKFNQELKIVQTNNKHDIEKLVKQYEVDIEGLKEKHKLEMETKNKEYEHEKEMLELKSKVAINEKSQKDMNGIMSSVMGNTFNDLISGKLNIDDLNKLSNQFSKNKK